MPIAVNLDAMLVKRKMKSKELAEIIGITTENINLLKMQVYEFTKDISFKKSKNMGEVIESALDFVRRNYEGVSMQ